MNSLLKCFTTLFFVFIYFGSQAQSNNQPKIALTFFSEKGERFWVVINGVRQNQQAQQNVKVPDLTGNAWKAQILFENEYLPEVGKSIYIPTAPTKDAELVYQIKRNRKGVYQVRLFSSTGFPNQMIEIIKDGSGALRLPRLPFPDIEINTNPRPFPRVPTDNPAPRNPTRPTDRNCQSVMDERSFDNLKDQIEAQSFEETKSNTAKQAIRYYCVSSMQARQILKLFSFEQTKLEFAKWVYDYVYDPQNFYQVNDVFDFSMSVDELQEYIRNKR